ncbi:GH25 family lysozyme [Cytobacillus sp. Hz8]|uniref:GH25 family lysozyme n=1 Tax=Cytobacillus sp. Hz8 TaxID=3347168 RepID=UPI0035D6BB7F
MLRNATLVDICGTFLSIVEDAGYYVSLYASKSWLDNQLNSSKLDKYDKWVAQWGSKCTYDKSYGMWQYTNAGTVKGIGGRVDMNYAYKDYSAIIRSKNKPATKPKTAPAKKKGKTLYLPKTDSKWRVYPLKKSRLKAMKKAILILKNLVVLNTKSLVKPKKMFIPLKLVILERFRFMQLQVLVQ